MRGDWYVILQDLPASGLSWAGDVPRGLLQDPAVGDIDALHGLTGDIRWRLSIRHHGGVYRLHGQWRGGMTRRCSRCNAEFEWRLNGETERYYRLGRGSSGDAECDWLEPPGCINLVNVLREDVWLSWKADVICDESCKGLCSQCGCNRNIEACRCEQVIRRDHPFAALAALKLDG